MHFPEISIMSEKPPGAAMVHLKMGEFQTGDNM
jgi:hypothetical protein